MSEGCLHVERVEPSIVKITLNRPEKRNALNIPLLQELFDNVAAINEDPTIRVVLLGGNGPIFCAGLDLQEACDPATAERSAKLIAKSFSILRHSPHITIAAVHGAAVAGGAGLMAACDIAIAAEGTKFGFPETKRGLVAALVLTLLERQLLQRDLNELLLLGELIDCRKALAIGLINNSVPECELATYTLALAEKALATAPRATALTKKLIDELSSFDSLLQKALSIHGEVRDSDEAKEGILAFVENRPPAWRRKNEDMVQ